MEYNNSRILSRPWGTALLIVFISFHIYVISFIVLARPCEKLNRAYDGKTGVMIIENTTLYPSGTLLCISENITVNKVCYFAYWPLHKFLEWRGMAQFAYIPQKLEKQG
ncbi:MAG TPA: hypothetical protein PKB02_03590 [Anaerohalosphaeraceae bacterium]|nr:hypothetical protein [Anaerohalosphaeraceae bacterium]